MAGRYMGLHYFLWTLHGHQTIIVKTKYCTFLFNNSGNLLVTLQSKVYCYGHKADKYIVIMWWKHFLWRNEEHL